MKKFFSKYQFVSTFILLLALANAVYLTHNIIGWVITLGFFLIVPGYLLLTLLKHTIKSNWEILGFSLGLSLLILMLGGLALNSLHAFGLQRPLTTWNIFITLDAITLVLLLLNKNRVISLPRRMPHPSREQLIMFVAITLLPFLAIGGAIRLNNGASNILTMVLYSLIALIFVVLVWRKNLQPLFPYAIIMIGLSFLFAVSLRDWFITGTDIQREFYVFQLTGKSGFWDISKYRNTYNACLSITILPTIIDKITTISALYIYKVVFQIIFAVGTIPAYFFMKRLSNAKIALLGAFLFVSFPAFLTVMPFDNRNEIAFIFFNLLMLGIIILNKNYKSKKVLLVLCLIGIIISHYSSSYAALVILLLSWLIFKLLTHHKRYKESVAALPFLSFPIIIVALLLTFLWNFQLTNTASGLKTALTSTIGTMLDQSPSGYKFATRLYVNPQEQLDKYVGSDINNIQFINQPQLPSTTLNNYVSRHFDGINLSSISQFIEARNVETLSLLAFIWALIQLAKKKQHQYYLATLALASTILFFIHLLFPVLSTSYGTGRSFQQILIIVSLPIIMILISIFRFTKISIAIVTIILLVLFFNFSGMLPQIFGNYPAQLALANSGLYYDNYYVNYGEILSGNWLVLNVPHNMVVSEDYSSSIRLTPITGPNLQTVNPFATISPYFYQDSLNLKKGLYTIYTGQNTVYYKLNTNPSLTKDLVYVNQSSDIYK
jgi:uncharacterized membrane protein